MAKRVRLEILSPTVRTASADTRALLSQVLDMTLVVVREGECGDRGDGEGGSDL